MEGKTTAERRTTLVLVRHGETEENAQHILQGHMPGTLSPLGKIQATEAAERLRSVAFDVCVCSDLKRCKDTAHIIYNDLGLPESGILYTRLLRERDWGALTGISVADTPHPEMPADAESLPALKARVRIFLDFVQKTYPGQRVLCVSHGFVLRIMQAVNAGVDFHDIQMMTNAEVREIELKTPSPTTSR